MKIARKPTQESRQYQRDLRDRKKHIQLARSEFRQLLDALTPYAEDARAQFPGRDKQSIQRRGRAFVKLVKDLPVLNDYLDKFIGTNEMHSNVYSWRNAVLYQARNALMAPGYTQRDALKKVEKEAEKGFQAITMFHAQAPLRETLPDQIRAFLPENVVVEVDDDGTISKVTDRFENEHLTLAKKIKRMHYLIRHYNEIARKVKKDLKSSDEITRLAALITAILMETGIRPGKHGNAAIKTVNGEKIEVETFGAITLGPPHVRFVRDNFAELSFVGKKGGVNTAQLSDAQIIAALKNYVDKALQSGSKYVFRTSDGQEFTYVDLQRYFRERFKNISPTDFRKLKATEVVLEALREEQVELFRKIKSFTASSTEDLKARVVEAVTEAINNAILKAQEALSHESAAVTIKDYINPEVILRYLSTGRVEDTLELAVLKGTSYLKFDPDLFIELAMSKAASIRVGLSLMELMDELEEELEEGGIRVSAIKVAFRYMAALPGIHYKSPYSPTTPSGKRQTPKKPTKEEKKEEDRKRRENWEKTKDEHKRKVQEMFEREDREKAEAKAKKKEEKQRKKEEKRKKKEEEGGGFQDKLKSLWKSYKKDHPKSEKPPKSLVEKAKKADLMPPLGYPGGPCHVIHRIEDEISNPKLKGDLIEDVEENRDLSNPEAAKVYDLEAEKGPQRAPENFKRMTIGPHTQYRMDLRGVTVNEVRLALQHFVKAWGDEKSRVGKGNTQWDRFIERGEPINWTDPKIGLTIVFKVGKRGVHLVTTYWKGQTTPKMPSRGCPTR